MHACIALVRPSIGPGHSHDTRSPCMAESKNDRRQALELAISQIERQFGKGSVMRLGAGGPLEEISVIPTGALSLDHALGIGGLPRGRVVEIYGPESSGKTTLALHVIAEAQRLGGIAAFIDAEHALDPIYARKLGVNRAELDGDMGDSLPGLQARLMSQALRKLTAAISRSGAVVVFINQIREKIGVMFGCLDYGTRVVLADGRREKIGKIVNQRMAAQVLSFDPATGRIEPRRIVNWFNNGRSDRFIQFEVEGGRSGYRHFAATDNHIVFTPRGRMRAGALKVGDDVLLGVEDYRLTDEQFQVIVGGGLGDGSIRKAGAHSAHFRVGHGPAQKDYLRWKQEMLAPFAGAIGKTGNGFGFDTLAMPAIADIWAELYANGRRAASAAALDRLDARGLAVWYGDDGSFAGSYARWGKGKAVLYNTSLAADARTRIIAMLVRLDVGRPRDDGRGFWFTSEQTARLHALIAPYVHPSMDYELHPSQRGRFAWPAPLAVDDLGMRRVLRAVPAKITKCYIKPSTRSTHRFDLEIEGHHTYLAGGVVVHNSPETTTGGRALKFYASVRLDIRRQEAIKQGKESIGVRTKVKVVKNKLAPPFREAEFDVLYGEGISKSGTVLDAAVEQNLVEKSGTWYSFKNERIGQGRENAKKWLQENPAALADLEAKVREALGLRAPATAW